MGIPRDFEGLSAEMVNTIKHKAWNLVGSFNFTESDRDDIEQDLALHLLKCLPGFNSRRGKLLTFINGVLDYKVATIIRARTNRFYDFRMHSYSLNEPCIDAEGFAIDRGDELEEDGYLISSERQSRPTFDLLEMRVDIDRVVSTLPNGLREVCQQLQVGNVTDVVRATGFSRSKVYSEMAKLKTIFHEAGLDDYL